MTTTLRNAGTGDQDVRVCQVQSDGTRAVVFSGDLPPGMPGCVLFLREDTQTGRLSFERGVCELGELSADQGGVMLSQVEDITRDCRSQGEGHYTMTLYGLIPDPEGRTHAMPLRSAPDLPSDRQWRSSNRGQALVKEARAQFRSRGVGGTLVVWQLDGEGLCDHVTTSRIQVFRYSDIQGNTVNLY